MQIMKPLQSVIFLLAAVVALTSCRESEEHRIDREVGWQAIKKPYYKTTHGLKIGEITVPGHTQRVTFFLWGIPKEDYYDEGDEPLVIGEMDRDADFNSEGSDDLGDLDRLAIAAYNHGALRVILAEHKAYLVTSDVELDDWAAYMHDR